MPKIIDSQPRKLPFPHSATAAPMDALCAAIKADDLARFDELLPAINDLDADKGRLLRTCVEHDRFAMAKKLFLRGVASTLVLGALKQEREESRYYYDMDDYDDFDERAHRRYQKAEAAYKRLSDWRTTFEKDVMPILSMQKIEDLQAQIAALRQEIAEVIAPARSIIKKSSATPTP